MASASPSTLAFRQGVRLVHRLFALCCLCTSAVVLRADGNAGGAPDLSADEIISRMIERAEKSAKQQGQHGLAFTRRTVIEELDDHAQVSESTSREHVVTNLAGSTHSVLVKLDGHAPSARDRREDVQREDEHEHETTHRRGARPSGPDYLDASLVHRFDFQFDREDVLDGRRMLVLRFEPKPGLKDGGEIADRLLVRLHGFLWVDAQEYELAKVETHLLSPLKILGGIAASLHRIDLVILRHRLPSGLWINREMLSYAEGRKLFSGLRIRMQIDQEDFREVSVPAPAPTP